MSEMDPEHCPKCSKPMDLHLTKVVDGKLTKLSLCSKCSDTKKYTESKGFELIENNLGAKEESISSDSSISCPKCGLTPSDFKETGRLGCPACYEVYDEKLLNLYRKLHNGVEHMGKTPQGKKRHVSPEQIEALKQRMQELVIREEYEMAAVVRDQIRLLEE